MAINRKGPSMLKLEPSNNTGVMCIALNGSFNDLSDSVTTPISPSSVFTSAKLKNIPHSIISSILFCHWDNILGPRLEHAWFIDGMPETEHASLRHVCLQVLSGEICRNPLLCHIDYKLYNLTDRGIVVPCFVFSAKKDFSVVIHALALVIPASELNVYLRWHTLIQSWLIRIISKFRILLNKPNHPNCGLEECSIWLIEFLEMLSSLHKAGLPQTIRLSETGFSPSHNLEHDFLHRAISSHLMTFGRSLVIGSIPERVNLVISTLAMFNSEAERATSRKIPLDPEKQWAYHHDLSIQGILKFSDGSFSVPVKELLCNRYPSTIIDIQNRDVRQSPFCQSHIVHSYETLKNELICVHYNHDQEINVNGIFESNNYPDTIVLNFIAEIIKLPAVYGVRDAYIAQFMRLLARKAFCLIKYVEQETRKGMIPLKGGLKRLKQDLSLTPEGNFRIVLAAAEKLKPGIYNFLLGETKYEMEHLTYTEDNAPH